MAVDKKISATLSLNDQFSAKLKKVASELTNTGDKFQNFADKVSKPVNFNTTGVMSKLKSLGSQATNTGSIMKTAIGSAIGNTVANGVSASIGFIQDQVGELTDSMQTTQVSANALQKVMEFKGLNTEQFEKLNKANQDLAAATNIGTADANNFASVLIGTGVDAEKTATIVAAATKANQAFGGSGDAFTSVRIAMGQMASAGKVSAENMNQITDANAALGAALKSQVMDNAKKAGKGLTDFNSAVTDGKISVDDLNQAMIDLQKKGGDAIPNLKDSMDGLKETISNKLQPAFDKLTKWGAKKLGKFTDNLSDSMDKVNFGSLGDNAQKAMEKIAKSIGIVNMDSFVSGLKRGLEKGIDFFGDFGSKAVGAFKVVSGVVSEVKGAVERFMTGFNKSGAIDATGRALTAVGDAMSHVFHSLGGGQLVDGINDVNEGLEGGGFKTGKAIEKIANAVEKLAQKVAETDPDKIRETANHLLTMGTALVGLRAGLAVVGPLQTLITAIGEMGGLAGVAQGAMGAIGTAIGAISWPIIAAIAAVVAMFTAFQTNFGGIRDFVMGAMDAIAEAMGPTIENLQSAWESLVDIVEPIVPVFEAVGAVLLGVVVVAIVIVVGAIQMLVAAVTIALQAVAGFGKALGQLFSGDFKGAAKTAKSTWGDIKETFSNGFGEGNAAFKFGDMLDEQISKAKDAAKESGSIKIQTPQLDSQFDAATVLQGKTLQVPVGPQLPANANQTIQAELAKSPVQVKAQLQVENPVLASSIVDTGKEAGDGFGKAVQPGAKKASDTMKASSDKMVNSGKGAASQMTGIGASASNNLAAGIASGTGAVAASVDGINAQLSRLGQGIPSVSLPGVSGITGGSVGSASGGKSSSKTVVGPQLPSSSKSSTSVGKHVPTSSRVSNTTQRNVTISVGSGAFQVNEAQTGQNTARSLFNQFNQFVQDDMNKSLVTV
jgi:tape measure domain-containing protein